MIDKRMYKYKYQRHLSSQVCVYGYSLHEIFPKKITAVYIKRQTRKQNKNLELTTYYPRRQALLHQYNYDVALITKPLKESL